MRNYTTNWMGPVNQEWIAKNGDNWCAGRIDISGGHMFDDEIGLPPMHQDDWATFSKWLESLQTKKQLDLPEIVEMYEKERPPIRWFKEEDNEASE